MISPCLLWQTMNGFQDQGCSLCYVNSVQDAHLMLLGLLAEGGRESVLTRGWRKSAGSLLPVTCALCDSGWACLSILGKKIRTRVTEFLWVLNERTTGKLLSKVKSTRCMFTHPRAASNCRFCCCCLSSGPEEGQSGRRLVSGNRMGGGAEASRRQGLKPHEVGKPFLYLAIPAPIHPFEKLSQ